jgi:hypothetical protein
MVALLYRNNPARKCGALAAGDNRRFRGGCVAGSGTIAGRQVACLSQKWRAMDKLQGMRAFVKVVEHGGFAAAARELRLSRSAVSKYVIELEEEGAVANVVGIRRGAISGNMRISFQAARSIG